MAKPTKQPVLHCKYDELKDPKSLNYHPKNRNKHPADQIERLAKILEYQGWRYPIKISKQSGFITSGHGRVAAALKNKWAEVPVVYQDYTDTDQEYADLQADNSIASWSELDLSGINLDIADLGPDFDLDMLGLKDFTLDVADKFADKDADEIPEVKEAITKPGDLWILGNHRLLCGDATDKASVERLMNGEKADMVYTDPPYGMNLDASYSNMAKNSSQYKTKRQAYKNVIGDDKAFSPSHLFEIECDEMFLWGADYYVWDLPKNGSWIVWDKREDASKGINTDGMFGSSFELCWSRVRHSRDIARFILSGGYMNKNDKQDFRVHPTQKPVALHEWFFERWGKDKTNIVDLYGGSGSTLIACEKTNKRCFMSEIDPHYCDVIVARWEKFTGEKAVKLG
jgi:DNA modification methylase